MVHTQALGHYYTGAVSVDPWLTVAYTSDVEGKASGELTVDTGSSSLDVNGRSVLVHARDGSRIACALLGTGLASGHMVASGFVPYYNNPGFTVSGRLSALTRSGSTTQEMSYAFSGADPNCASGADTSVTNSCGIQYAAPLPRCWSGSNRCSAGRPARASLRWVCSRWCVVACDWRVRAQHPCRHVVLGRCAWALLPPKRCADGPVDFDFVHV